MIRPSDKDYKSTKKVKRKTSSIKEEFAPLARWIDEKYDVKTLNIIFDYLDKKKSHPRLQVCLEYAKDKGKFMDNKTYNFDERKQKDIARKFAELTSNYNLKPKSNWFKKWLGISYKSNNLFVYFTDFESVAKIEANEKISEKEINQLQANIDNQDLWTISKAFTDVIFFLYTDEQLDQYQDSSTHKEWSIQYYQLLQEHDEFGYFKKENFYISLDSKENFDTNYQSNWYYYFK